MGGISGPEISETQPTTEILASVEKIQKKNVFSSEAHHFEVKWNMVILSIQKVEFRDVLQNGASGMFKYDFYQLCFIFRQIFQKKSKTSILISTVFGKP